MNNSDMQKIMAMLAKMDKKDLEAGIAKASSILNSKDKNAIIEQLKNNNKKRLNYSIILKEVLL